MTKETKSEVTDESKTTDKNKVTVSKPGFWGMMKNIAITLGVILVVGVVVVNWLGDPASVMKVANVINLSQGKQMAQLSPTPDGPVGPVSRTTYKEVSLPSGISEEILGRAIATELLMVAGEEMSYTSYLADQEENIMLAMESPETAKAMLAATRKINFQRVAPYWADELQKTLSIEQMRILVAFFKSAEGQQFRIAVIAAHDEAVNKIVMEEYGVPLTEDNTGKILMEKDEAPLPDGNTN